MEKVSLFQNVSGIESYDLCVEILSRNSWDVEMAIDSNLHNIQVLDLPPDRGTLGEFVLRLSQWLCQSRPKSLHPDAESIQIIRDFESTFGTLHAPCHIGSFSSSVRRAYRCVRPLLVYFFTPASFSYSVFSRQVLCSESFIHFVRSELVLWLGSVWDLDALSYSRLFGNRTAPFLVLLHCENENSFEVMDTIPGIIQTYKLYIY